MIRVLGLVGVGVFRGVFWLGVIRGLSVGGVNWNFLFKLRLWLVCVILWGFWLGLEV